MKKVLTVIMFSGLSLLAQSQLKDLSAQNEIQDNTLTNTEISQGWRLLFDGSTSDGWISARTGKFPLSGWEISNGVLSVNPDLKKEGEGGDIVTTSKFRNFELSIDFMYPEGANSGIKYFINTEDENGALASIGCEYQILDDVNHPDAKAGFAGNRTLAGLYDLIAPFAKHDNGHGKWNRATIVVKDSKVQHWLNGYLTVEYERGNDAWRDLVAKSKFNKVKGFGESPEGRILLQDHGNKVSFRNIKIREIK